MPQLRDLIERSFDRGTIERGLAYWRNGYVDKVKTGPDFVEAHVSGSDDYEVQIQLSGVNVGRDGISLDEISGECSCPVGWQCKHVVATLAEWSAGLGFPPAPRGGSPKPAKTAAGPAAKPEPFPDLEQVVFEPWLDEIVAAQRWTESALVDEGERVRVGDLHYVFTHQHARLSMTVVGSRRLKSGELGVGKRFGHLRQVGLSSGRDYATDEDLALVAMMLAFCGEYDNDPGLRRPPAFLIERLLVTGRCHWNDYREPPLRLLDPTPATLCWAQKADRRRIAIVDAQGSTLELVRSEPPWQVSAAGMGPLIIDLTPARLAAVIGMPWLSSPLLRASVEALPLPLPDGLTPVVAPRPVLRVVRRTLAWATADGRRRRSVEVGVVTYRYGADELGVDGPALMVGGDGAAVSRDAATERERGAELARLGLRRWPPPGIHTQGDNEHLRGQPLHVPIDRLLAPGDDAVAIPPAVLLALRGSGWDVVGASPLPEVALIELDQVAASVDERDGGDWFELHLGIDVGGRRIDLVPLLTPLLRGGPEAWSRLPRAVGEPPAVLATCGDTSVLRVPLALIESLHAQTIGLESSLAANGELIQRMEQKSDLMIESVERSIEAQKKPVKRWR